ncbi:MAG: tetraacyldisaccharide 4'-kinase, partial [Candidatus Omnitrophica bacterium]|nr:tetraacyldisaccharide 4'-kinase [Candidatus Omnitrophota bacterium]
YLEFMLRNVGLDVVSRQDYPDHYFFSQCDIMDIAGECREKNIECVIVTKKDFVKLKRMDISSIEEKLFILNIAFEILEGKEILVAGLNRVLSCKTA